MSNEELTTKLEAVKTELNNASSAYALNHYVDRASALISAFDVPDNHRSKSHNREFDIRHDAIGSLNYTMHREVGWAKSASSGILKSAKKRAEAQNFLNKAISQLERDIDSFLSAIKP